MIHLDEATLLAVRDDAPAAGEARTHLRDCPECGAALDEARARARRIASTLDALDEPVDASAAKAAVRRRLDARRRARPIALWRRIGLGRAAALLLLTAGAVYALPGSPLRRWWAGEPERPATAAAPATAQAEPTAGIALEPLAGSLDLVVRGAAPGTEIEVVFGSGGAARISAPAGSSFSYAPGRAEVEVRPGPIRIELPDAAQRVGLEVDGTTYLEQATGELLVPGPILERTDALVRFRVPAR